MGTTWTRKYIWDATSDLGSVKIADITLAVETEYDYGGVQLWEGGPYWAECNVGASSPEDYGYYFWWGDTVGYKRNSDDSGWVSVKDGSSFSFSNGNAPTYGMDNSSLLSAGYIDSIGVLAAEHDAATAHLGSPWRMPTDAEFSELINNCDRVWTNFNGVAGLLVTGRSNYASRRVFFPAAGEGSENSRSDVGSQGRYWPSVPLSSSTTLTYDFYLNSGGSGLGNYYRLRGRSVRPVRTAVD